MRYKIQIQKWNQQVKLAWISVGFLLVVQLLSFISLFINPEISGEVLKVELEIILYIIATANFYLLGVIVATLLVHFWGPPAFFSIESRVSIETFNHRIFLLVIIIDIVLISLVWNFGSLRRDLFVGWLTLLGIPISILATKIPLLFVVTKNHITIRDWTILVVHYIFLAYAYESKMGLIYLLILASLCFKVRGIIVTSFFVALGVGLMVIWSAISNDNLPSSDIWDTLYLSAQSFLNRFDSIRVAIKVLESNHINLVINNMFDALMRLYPTCSATQNCLNLSAEISERIVGIDISVAVYEINIVSEATIFFNKLAVPFYLFLVGLSVTWCLGVFSLRFSKNKISIPISAICFILLPSSIWSAGFFSTRVMIFFFIELICLMIIIYCVAKIRLK